MSQKNYDFSYMTFLEKKKIFGLKLLMIMFASTSFLFFASNDHGDLASILRNIAGILASIHFYVNLSTVKSEIIELFEPPYRMIAMEIAYSALFLIIASMVLVVMDIVG